MDDVNNSKILEQNSKIEIFFVASEISRVIFIFPSFRITFLYSKMYFFFHSCLASLGMKNLCPDIQFDGVQFQKLYEANNVNKEKQPEEDDGNSEQQQESKKENEDGEVFSQTKTIDEFAAVIRN